MIKSLLLISILSLPASAQLIGGEITATAGGSAHGNGANCAAGQYPKGVDANGAVESCTAIAEGDIDAGAITSGKISSGAVTSSKIDSEALQNFTGRIGVPFGGSQTDPFIRFGDNDTGFYESFDDAISFTAGGSRQFVFQSGGIKSNLSGFNVRNVTTSSTEPTYAFQADTASGIGQGGVGSVFIITNNLPAIQVDSTQQVIVTTMTQVYVGGSAFVCIDNNGRLFASEVACP